MGVGGIGEGCPEQPLPRGGGTGGSGAQAHASYKRALETTKRNACCLPEWGGDTGPSRKSFIPRISNLIEPNYRMSFHVSPRQLQGPCLQSVPTGPVAGLRLDVASRRVTRDRVGEALRTVVGRNQLGSPRVAERAVLRGAEQVGPAGPRAIEPLVITEPRLVRAAAVVDASEAVAAQQAKECVRAYARNGEPRGGTTGQPEHICQLAEAGRSW